MRDTPNASANEKAGGKTLLSERNKIDPTFGQVVVQATLLCAIAGVAPRVHITRLTVRCCMPSGATVMKDGSQWDQYLLLHNHWVPQRRRRGDLGRRLGQVDCAHSNGDTGSDL